MTTPYMRSLLGLNDPPRRRGVEGLLDQLQTSPFGEDDPDFDPNPLKKAKKPIPTRAAEANNSPEALLEKGMRVDQGEDPNIAGGSNLVNNIKAILTNIPGAEDVAGLAMGMRPGTGLDPSAYLRTRDAVGRARRESQASMSPGQYETLASVPLIPAMIAANMAPGGRYWGLPVAEGLRGFSQAGTETDAQGGYAPLEDRLAAGAKGVGEGLLATMAGETALGHLGGTAPAVARLATKLPVVGPAIEAFGKSAATKANTAYTGIRDFLDELAAKEAGTAAPAARRAAPSILADTVAGKALGKVTGTNKGGGVPLVQELADEYNATNPHYADLMGRTPKADAPLGREIANWYDKASSTPTDPETIASYRAFAKETQQQADFLKKKGVRFEYVEENPYNSSADMMKDVMQNKRLKVFKTPEDFNHPLLSAEENDLFRAVHDFFGHAKEGNQFGATGEENAYRIHSAMYSDLARKAMATETRGQNSWVNFGPFGEQNRKNPANTIYADQKTMLMPDALRTRLLDSLPARIVSKRGQQALETIGPSAQATQILGKIKGWSMSNIELATGKDPRFKGIAELPSETALQLQLGAAGTVTRPLAKAAGLEEGKDWSVGPTYGWWGGTGASGNVEPSIGVEFAPHVPVEKARAVLLAQSKIGQQAAMFVMHPDPKGASTGLHIAAFHPDGTPVPGNQVIDLINEGRSGWDGAVVRGENLDQVTIGATGLVPKALAKEIERIHTVLDHAGFDRTIKTGPVTTELIHAKGYDRALERTGVRGNDWNIAYREASRLYEGVAGTTQRLVAANRIAERADAADLAIDISQGNRSAALKYGKSVYTGTDHRGASYAAQQAGKKGPPTAEGFVGTNGEFFTRDEAEAIVEMMAERGDEAAIGTMARLDQRGPHGQLTSEDTKRLMWGAGALGMGAGAAAPSGEPTVGPTKENERAAAIAAELKAMGIYRGKK